MELENLFSKHFHYEKFRPGQKEVISQILIRKAYTGHVTNRYWKVTMFSTIRLLAYQAMF